WKPPGVLQPGRGTTRKPHPRTGLSDRRQTPDKAIPGVWVFSCQIRRRSGSRQRAPLPVRMRSSADAELLDQGPVAGDVFVAQVLEQALTLADLQQQTTTAVVVVLVHLEVLGEVIDVV